MSHEPLSVFVTSDRKMPERPAIPTELRRRILFEAGHRCAIHTCRHIDVDIHHIEPWSRCQEHRFENLIALCPNCHRRAEDGKIDRKSLRLYKARLAAALRFEGVDLYPEETVLPAVFAWIDPSGEWRTETVVKDGPRLDIALEYPQFSTRIRGVAATGVNRHILGYVEESIMRFTTGLANPPDIECSMPYHMNSSFSVTLVRPSMLSIRFSMTAYTGGAHGSHWTEALNLTTSPARSFGIEDLFTDPATGLNELSVYAIQELLAASNNGISRDERRVREGAAPDAKNFESFNLTSRGVLLTFDEYQVGIYPGGSTEVHVPYHVVSRILNPVVAAEVLGTDA